MTLAWSAQEEALRLVCAFELAPPARRLPAIHAAMALANDRCWSGAFVLWPDQKMMAYRYSLNLTGGAQAELGPDQRHGPELASSPASASIRPSSSSPGAARTPEKALGIAMSEAYGRA